MGNIVRLVRFFKLNNVHIVHNHAWGGGSFYGILGARIARVPAVINGEHGIFFDKPHQVLAQRVLFYLCDANLSVSETLKAKTNKILGVPLHKIQVIKNGVDTTKFSGSSAVSQVLLRLKEDGFFLDDRYFVIFSIGSLKPDKAQMRLLRAAKRIRKIEPENSIKYVFIGDGVDRASLLSFVEKEGLDESVVFLGHRSDVPELLSIADVLVSTSMDEGLSNVMLEAMSSGIPIIATKSLGTAELITDGIDGFLVEQEDEVQLSEVILKLYRDNSLLTKMGSNARELIYVRYSIERMVQGYERIYSSLMAAKQ